MRHRSCLKSLALFSLCNRHCSRETEVRSDGGGAGDTRRQLNENRNLEKLLSTVDDRVGADGRVRLTADADAECNVASGNKENGRTDSEESLKEIAGNDTKQLDRMQLFAANVRQSTALDFELTYRTTNKGRPLPRCDTPSSPLSGTKRKGHGGFASRRSPERSSFKQSESTSELISRENSKKRSMKKKKRKTKGAPRELPPILGPGRPLPKLPTLDEERAHVTDC